MTMRDVWVALHRISKRSALEYACQAALHGIKLDPEAMSGSSSTPAEEELTEEQVRILEREMARHKAMGARNG